MERSSLCGKIVKIKIGLKTNKNWMENQQIKSLETKITWNWNAHNPLYLRHHHPVKMEKKNPILKTGLICKTNNNCKIKHNQAFFERNLQKFELNKLTLGNCGLNYFEVVGLNKG